MRGAGADQISVLVRPMVESKASKHVLQVGFAFHFQRGAQITVTDSSYSKLLKLHAIESIDDNVPVTPGIQMVEVTAPASAENYTEVAATVSSFCEYLAPYVPGIM
ncbi:putative mediator complex, subunit Med18 [Helianthus anomalus]